LLPRRWQGIFNIVLKSFLFYSPIPAMHFYVQAQNCTTSNIETGKKMSRSILPIKAEIHFLYKNWRMV
jgi:hypothetical protein